MRDVSSWMFHLEIKHEFLHSFALVWKFPQQNMQSFDVSQVRDAVYEWFTYFQYINYIISADRVHVDCRTINTPCHPVDMLGFSTCCECSPIRETKNINALKGIFCDMCLGFLKKLTLCSKAASIKDMDNISNHHHYHHCHQQHTLKVPFIV